MGVLKEFVANEQIDLSADKTEALETVTMGHVSKIFLHFPSKFWPDSGHHDFTWADEKQGRYTIWRDIEDRIPGFNVLLCMAAGLTAYEANTKTK